MKGSCTGHLPLGYDCNDERPRTRLDPPMFRRALALFVLIPWLFTAAMAQAQAVPCQFVLGFAALHNLASAVVGDCLDNQTFSSNGDAQQHTTGGLLVWRKVDNWTAFTDGYRTWINGPNGLQQRLNTERFSWEANPNGLPDAGGDSNASAANGLGGLSGELNYPSNYVPDLWVFAVAADGSSHYYSLHTGESSHIVPFEMDGIAPGAYYLLAMPCSLAPVCNTMAGYTRAVACGLTIECGDHTLIAVVVRPGAVTANLKVYDWYAPRGSFCLPSWQNFTCN